jgi:hypothetical protein
MVIMTHDPTINHAKAKQKIPVMKRGLYGLHPDVSVEQDITEQNNRTRQNRRQ